MLMHGVVPGLACLMLLLGAVGWSIGGEGEPATAKPQAATTIDFRADVRPILAQRCFSCHGSLRQQAGLRVDSVADLLTGGESGPAIDPTSPLTSELLERISTTDPALRMPPPEDGEALRANEIELVRRWLEAGGSPSTHDDREPDPREHWSFRPVQRRSTPQPAATSTDPTFASEAIAGPIDAWIDQRLHAEGLQAVGRAEPALQLRRLYLDLWGVPPTTTELDAFLADRRPDAWERTVDQLLASPRYGERWGRHFMDIWRYSDWWGLGAEVRNSHKHLWHWRDWIIDSLNADVGYDEMLRQMLAADELYPEDPDKLRATGFLVRQYFLFNRNSWLDETVEHTGKAFLGLTLNCSRCHDHKYDPISQREYYQLRAIFEPYAVRIDQVPGQLDVEQDGLPRVFDCDLERATQVFIRGDEARPDPAQTVQPAVPAVLANSSWNVGPVTLPPVAVQPGLRPFVLADQLAALQSQRIELVERTAIAEHRRDELAAQIAQSKANRPEVTNDTAEAVATSPQSFDQWFRPDDSSSMVPVLSDQRFDSSDASAWEFPTGQWQIENGVCRQSRVSMELSRARLRLLAPADFVADVEFTTLGGEQWKSVGVMCDVSDTSGVLIYASAVAGGSKLQIAYRDGTAELAYPAEGARALPVSIGQPHRLTVAVRDRWIHVRWDQDTQLTYRLPVARRPGAIELITFDAKAEFDRFGLYALPSDVRLPGEQTVASPDEQLGVADAELAELNARLTAVDESARSLELRHRADRLIAAGSNTSSDVTEARLAAAKQERAAQLAEAVAALRQLEVAAAKAVVSPPADLSAKLDAARTAVANLTTAQSSESPDYTPVRGARKSPQSNQETLEARNRAFPAVSTGRRSALAHWLTDSQHPLTARVLVNHLWNRHFGQPLVASVFDFGAKGAIPSHPELLDELAAGFIRSGFSIKWLHREIVTSEAYRRSSVWSADDPARVRDPDNRWLSRWPGKRMESQAVRDSLLQVGHALDERLHGPSIPETHTGSRRRALYFFHSHHQHEMLLKGFDDANVLECYRRSESIVPQQSLALFNGELAWEIAGRVSDRLQTQAPNAQDAEFVQRAFREVLSVEPSADELTACLDALADWMQPSAAGNLTPVVAARARRNLVLALLNHHDFVQIR